MKEEQKLHRNHAEVRSTLRIVGPAMLGVGGLLTLIGFGSFFASFGSMEPPRFFWCAMLGLPLLPIGLFVTALGYLGAISRYQAGEVAPVGKDTFNYLARGTQDGVRTIATAAARGLTEGVEKAGASCPSCQHLNDAKARFCDECGASLVQVCSSCGERNDGDARFCDACGQALSANGN